MGGPEAVLGGLGEVLGALFVGFGQVLEGLGLLLGRSWGALGGDILWGTIGMV